MSKRLSKQVDPGVVLSLWELDADLVRRNPVPLDAPVCGPHQSDGNPTIGLSACPGVGRVEISLGLDICRSAYLL